MTFAANYLTKENGQSILVLVVYDVIMQVAYYQEKYDDKNIFFSFNSACLL